MFSTQFTINDTIYDPLFIILQYDLPFLAKSTMSF